MLIAALLAMPWEVDFQDDAKTLERRIGELEKKRKDLDRQIEEALEKGKGDEAVERRNEQKKIDQELGETHKKLAELRKKDASPPGFGWGVQAILTHWDNDLDLSDRVGWSAYVSFIPALTFEYSRWETEDEDGDDDALVQVYRLGFGATGSPLTDLTLGVVGLVGLVRFNSDAPGTDGDTGPIFSLHPGAVWKMGEHLSFSAGFLIDILRTDFNQEHTHTNHNVSLTVGLHVRW
ncbi:MAG TPA: hypothetical protein VF950_17010 [Planctomycetota bacterium]